MNFLKTGTGCLLLALCLTQSASAQASTKKDGDYRKPELFRDLPNRLPVTMTTLTSLLQRQPGDSVRVALSDGFVLTGIVVSKSPERDTQSKTVVIKALNRPGAAFTLSRVRKSDGTIAYHSRLLSLKHPDAYEMVPTENGFALQKTTLADLVSE